MPKEILDFILIPIWQVFKVWWWVLVPLILGRLFCNAWLWWRRELWEARQEYVILEIIPTAEAIEPISAMEHVFSAIWGIYSGIEGISKFQKKWIWGKKLHHLSLEIISIGNRPHIFMRLLKEHEDSVKAAFFSQYPNIEINRVDDDYTRHVSQSIPNKDWNIYGLDEYVVKPAVYPIKTYRMFFEEKPEMIREEEKRIDPLATLLEGMALLHPEKENLWTQIRITPVSHKDNDYQKRGKKLVDKLVYRRRKETGIMKEAAEVLVGPTSPTKEEAREAFIPPEMKLTPREREIVKAVEDKISKPVFEANIRLLYFGKPDIFRMGRRGLGENYFTSFATRDLNALKKWDKTRTRVYYTPYFPFFVKRRLYLRQKNIFWRYILREVPLYPNKGGTFILNTEELATIFHPPVAVRAVGTFLPRVEAKKGEPPTELPVEKIPSEEETPQKSKETSSWPIRARKREEPPELFEGQEPKEKI